MRDRERTKTRRRVAAAAVLLLLVSGCGSAVTAPRADPSPSSAVSPRPGQIVEGEAPSEPYQGPLFVPVSKPDDRSVVVRSGAAGRALECDGDPYLGGQEGYEQGFMPVQPSPEQALVRYLGHDLAGLPPEGYRLERRDADRVLYSFDVARRSRVVVVTADGIRDVNGERGWRVESWASCDPSEWPAAVTDAMGIEVWEDRTGRRVPLEKISSSFGDEHCGTQDVTFLRLGSPAEGRQYVGRPTPDLAEHLTTSYDATASLPRDATDTGFRRNGRSLWLDPERRAAYLVSLTDPDDVQRWPAVKQPILCA